MSSFHPSVPAGFAVATGAVGGTPRAPFGPRDVPR
jgi:hypothetical protein